MHSEVTLQAQSGGAESGVGVLEVRGCDGCCRYSMALNSGSNELLASRVLKVFNSFVSSAIEQKIKKNRIEKAEKLWNNILLKEKSYFYTKQ